jgi:hypothetical protein
MAEPGGKEMQGVERTTSEQIREDLERFTADVRYFDRHRQELLERYPEHWVAIYRLLLNLDADR